MSIALGADPQISATFVGNDRRTRARPADWQVARAAPVLLAWLFFYAVAIVGALTGPRPAEVAPAAADAAAPAPTAR